MLGAALQALRKYGVTHLIRYTSFDTPLYNAVIAHARDEPLETYAFAAENELEDLAVDCSTYTLRLVV